MAELLSNVYYFSNLVTKKNAVFSSKNTFTNYLYFSINAYSKEFDEIALLMNLCMFIKKTFSY